MLQRGLIILTTKFPCWWQFINLEQVIVAVGQERDHSTYKETSRWGPNYTLVIHTLVRAQAVEQEGNKQDMISLFTSQVTVWLRLLISSLHQFLDHSQNGRMFELVYSERLNVSNCESCEATGFGKSLDSHLQECLYLPFSWWLDLPLPIWNFPLQDSRSFFTCTTHLILNQLLNYAEKQRLYDLSYGNILIFMCQILTVH